MVVGSGLQLQHGPSACSVGIPVVTGTISGWGGPAFGRIVQGSLPVVRSLCSREDETRMYLLSSKRIGGFI